MNREPTQSRDNCRCSPLENLYFYGIFCQTKINLFLKQFESDFEDGVSQNSNYKHPKLFPLRANASQNKVFSIKCCHVKFQNEVVFRKHGCFEVAKNRRHAKQIHKPQSYRTRSFQTIWGESSRAYKLLH